MDRKMTRKECDEIAKGLRALGWVPSVNTTSMEGAVVGYSIGVVVEIGDDRFQWVDHPRNPLLDFISIAGAAANRDSSLSRRPVGFAWSMAGIDKLQLFPGRDDSIESFVERLTKISHAQMDLFSAPSSSYDELLDKRKTQRVSM